MELRAYRATLSSAAAGPASAPCVDPTARRDRRRRARAGSPGTPPPCRTSRRPR
jgi:hypothetical protein